MPSLPLSLNHPSVDGGVPDLDPWKPPTEVGVRGVGVGVTSRAASCTCMRSNVWSRCADLAERTEAHARTHARRHPHKTEGVPELLRPQTVALSTCVLVQTHNPPCEERERKCKENPPVTFTAHLQFNGTGCDALRCTWQVSS